MEFGFLKHLPEVMMHPTLSAEDTTVTMIECRRNMHEHRVVFGVPAPDEDANEEVNNECLN